MCRHAAAYSKYFYFSISLHCHFNSVEFFHIKIYRKTRCNCKVLDVCVSNRGFLSLMEVNSIDASFQFLVFEEIA